MAISLFEPTGPLGCSLPSLWEGRKLTEMLTIKTQDGLESYVGEIFWRFVGKKNTPGRQSGNYGCILEFADIAE